jgi:hypothetical protein
MNQFGASPVSKRRARQLLQGAVFFPVFTIPMLVPTIRQTLAGQAFLSTATACAAPRPENHG